MMSDTVQNPRLCRVIRGAGSLGVVANSGDLQTTANLDHRAFALTSVRLASPKQGPSTLFHRIEHRRTTRAMGNPTQKMCMMTPITNSCEENGYFIVPERGTTTRFMKK
jgi:hypothetical protein